jgi:alkylhydroperoxidase family enzyme
MPAEPPAEVDEQTKRIYERLKEHRKPRPLIPLDLTFLHSPRIAEGFSFLMGAVRQQSTLDPQMREIAICYVAVLNKATYEWKAHAQIALEETKIKPSVLETILRNDVKNSSVLSEEEIDVLDFTYQSTKNIKVDDGLVEKLKKRYTDRQVVELAMTVASYNMVSRLLVGLDITESNGKRMEMPKL